MKAEEALAKMKLPRDFRGPRKIFQIWVTRACDKSCFGCTQGSNLAGKPGMITPDQYLQAVHSMFPPDRPQYPGVVAMFGGNPCIHPQFEELCDIACRYIPYRQRGIWTNNLLGKGEIVRKTFNPAMSNVNVHLDKEAADEFRRDWPECIPYGIKGENHDCSHSPVYTAMKDLIPDEGERWELISNCDINQKWSAMIGVFRGELRGWFCEVAGAQSMLHQWDKCKLCQGSGKVRQRSDPDNAAIATYGCLGCNGTGYSYPDTGSLIYPGWWRKGLEVFEPQIRKHCHECGVPLRGIGSLAVGGTTEQVTETHRDIFQPKRKGRDVEVVVTLEQLGRSIPHATDYLANHKYHEGK